MYYKPGALILIMLFSFIAAEAQKYGGRRFSRSDTLRGSNGPGRVNWDVLHYDITIKPDFEEKSLTGNNVITVWDKGITTLQLDMQDPMMIDSVVSGNENFHFTREGNVYWVNMRSDTDLKVFKPQKRIFTVYFSGKPLAAANPPWDGGWIFTRDKNNNPWMSAACQQLGASSWYPCKDIQSDEPDNGIRLHLIVPDSLVGIGNGRLIKKNIESKGLTKYSWEIRNPINNYCVIPYIGKYAQFSEVLAGEKGKLDLNYWVLDYNIAKAKKHFAEVPKMIKAFEYWFGPYPFYEDGYKLVEAPFLGLETQSAIAYGNEFKNGYRGVDWSASGVGLLWDFIIIHESGHEWFGNNITTKDIADIWVHEAFATYSEVLYTEKYYGKNSANKYCVGLRKNIMNNAACIGNYDVNDAPTTRTTDMYWKGANMIHTIRQVINNDVKFRGILKDMNRVFYHKVVTGKEVEDFICKQANFDFSKIFDQYLRTTKIPVFTYRINAGRLYYKWDDVVDQFNLPLKVSAGGKARWINPTPEWQSLSLKKNADTISVDRNFYVLVNKTDQ